MRASDFFNKLLRQGQGGQALPSSNTTDQEAQNFLLSYAGRLSEWPALEPDLELGIYSPVPLLLRVSVLIKIFTGSLRGQGRLYRLVQIKVSRKRSNHTFG